MSVMKNETKEENFLDEHVWEPFIEAGLMSDKNQLDKIHGPNGCTIDAVIGLPDNVTFAGESAAAASANPGKLTALVECKSSHNLLVPNKFEKLKKVYEEAVEHQMKSRDEARSTEWSQVCHPFGKVICLHG